MFYNYQILNSNDEEILYLYISSMYEFSNELDQNNKSTSIFNKVKDYIKLMDIPFEGKKVMLVIDGLVMASLSLDADNLSNNNNIDYQENLEFDKHDNVDVIDMYSKSSPIKYMLENNNDSFIISNFVKMREKDGRFSYVDLNNYIINELRKEASPTYEEEALKSVAIIVRTKILKELSENNYLDGEKYQNTNFLKKIWGNNFATYFRKLHDVIEETSSQYISHNNYYFNFDTRDNYHIPFSIYQANILAKRGYGYLDILGHFYPDAVIAMV